MPKVVQRLITKIKIVSITITWEEDESQKPFDPNEGTRRLADEALSPTHNGISGAQKALPTGEQDVNWE